MPHIFTSTSLPHSSEKFTCRQAALLQAVNSPSFQMELQQKRAFSYIAGVNEFGHLVGLDLECGESEKAFTSYMENLQELCKGLSSSSASYMEYNYHALCLIDPPTETATRQLHVKQLTQKHKLQYPLHNDYNPTLSFNYACSLKTQVCRHLLNSNAEYLSASPSKKSLYIKHEELPQSSIEVLLELISEYYEDTSDSELWVNGDNFFITTKGSIESCKGFTWGGILNILSQCELPNLPFIVDNTEAMDISSSNQTYPLQAAEVSFRNKMKRSRNEEELPTNNFKKQKTKCEMLNLI